MKNMIIGIIVLVLFALWLLLPLIGINSSNLISHTIEWATTFILPWIFLYWIVKFIKKLEKNQ